MYYENKRSPICIHLQQQVYKHDLHHKKGALQLQHLKTKQLHNLQHSRTKQIKRTQTISETVCLICLSLPAKIQERKRWPLILRNLTQVSMGSAGRCPKLAHTTKEPFDKHSQPFHKHSLIMTQQWKIPSLEQTQVCHHNGATVTHCRENSAS